MIEFTLSGATVRYDPKNSTITWGARVWRVEAAPVSLRIEIAKRMARAESLAVDSPRRVSSPKRKTNNGIIPCISARGKQKRNNPRT